MQSDSRIFQMWRCLFLMANVTAYVDGNQQRTEEITFQASSQQTITLDLPDGVKLHNVSTGKTSAAGASVTISGGTRFYLTAPLTQTKDVSGSWSVKAQGRHYKRLFCL